MATLLHQRRELELHLEHAARSRSPVHRLPSELLSWIFVLGVRDVDERDPVLVSSLMLVCRYWADVALNTPVLWSIIAVNSHGSLEKVHRKFTRSKSVPLDITLIVSPCLDHVEDKVTRAMDLIQPALWRTKAFRLSVPNRHQLDAVLARCQEDAPLLESFSVRVSHSLQEDFRSSIQTPLFNGRTPRLRSCSFTSFNFGWDVQFVSRLRVLKLGGYFNQFSPSVDTLMEVLRQCPELEELVLRNMSDVDPDTCFPPKETIVTHRILQLPRLLKASFYYAGVMRTHALLGQISLPALESLDFCYLDNLTPVLQHLQTQSLISLPLRYLRIESTFFNELKLIKLLRNLPTLVTFELIDSGDASSNFLKVCEVLPVKRLRPSSHRRDCQSLSTPPVAQPWICPKLVALNLDGCASLDWDSLRTFIQSRLPTNTRKNPSRSPIDPNSLLPSPQRICSLDVTRCPQINKEMLQWLRMYVADVRCEPTKGVWGEVEML